MYAGEAGFPNNCGNTGIRMHKPSMSTNTVRKMIAKGEGLRMAVGERWYE